MIVFSFFFFLSFVPSTYSGFFFFFFNDTATTEIYTLSLHDALPIFGPLLRQGREVEQQGPDQPVPGDRKSTRLNSSHSQSSYAVFCLKKKKKHQTHDHSITKTNKNNTL